MNRLRWVLSVAVVGLAAGCVVPAVADAPSDPNRECRRARDIVNAFVYEMGPIITRTPEDYQAWWEGHVKERIVKLGDDFNAAAAGCPAFG